jgi:hypothetical protein
MLTRRSLLVGAGLGLVLPRLAAAAVPLLKMADLYGAGDDFSPVAKEYAGKTVALAGFMAPPLKPDAKFFVLTGVPMAVCPFCADVAEWPEDIVVIYTKKAIEVLPFDAKLTASGRLEIGPWMDPATGFVSKVRLVGASYSGRAAGTPGPPGAGILGF